MSMTDEYTITGLCKDLGWNLNANPVSLEEAEFLQLFNDMFRKQNRVYVDWLQSEEARVFFTERNNRFREVFNNLQEELTEIREDMNVNADNVVGKIYERGLAKGFNDIRQVAVYSDAHEKSLGFLLDYNYGLIRSASDDFISMVQNTIFAGMASDKHPYEIARDLLVGDFEVPEGWNITPMQRARMIARTETARAWTTGTMQAYTDYGVNMIDIITAGDANVCPLCIENEENNPHPLSEATSLVPMHPNCRCAISAHVPHGEELQPVADPEPVNTIP